MSAPPFAQVLPRHVWELPYTLVTAGTLQLRVGSSLPVDVFVVDQQNRDAYRSGRPFVARFANNQNQLHSGQVAVGIPGLWYVLINNPHPEPSSVSVEVTFAPFAPPTPSSDGYWR